MEEGQTSSSVASQFILNYTDLPYYLQACLTYCCVFPENYWIPEGKLIRLLVAESLVQEKPGKIMEDIADENINILINQGMLQVNNDNRGQGTMLTVTSSYRCKIVEDNFITASAHSASTTTIPHNARRVSIYSEMATVAPLLNNIRPRSLFFLGTQDLSSDPENWLNFNWAKFVRVMDLERTKIESLPDGVGDLIHLRYLGLKHTGINNLPARIGNLRALQTLDIRWCGDLTALPVEVLNLAQLRHIKMYKRIKVGGVKLPPGIGRLRNLLTLTGIHASAGIARELHNLIHLRRLGVMDVAEENAVELFASIMMMQNLLSLSLEAKHTFNRETLVLLDTFSPPPLLRKLRLEGLLKKMPNWIGSMESLTNLRLGFSYLSENPALVLQLLPNLKNLIMWHAYDVKQLGKEFCRAGGFPKLEVLIIASHVLEEWTELEEGALPSLKYLHLHNCLQLRMLPEGLQFLTTLKQLQILPLLDEHAERLKPDGGEENYKISHIPQVSFIPMSVLRNSCQLPPCRPQEEGEQHG
ncbi:putative Disease resistance protein family [Melia azedarach]|uniref:Disease resistance protein family n=1 Tax=Melia azedarach TaxID=155640 RepID=A0ACC1XMJ6_MELAZ|nr:putative Disease resistance protein family [Melia azedarach]